jgi:hypothetical protein
MKGRFLNATHEEGNDPPKLREMLVRHCSVIPYVCVFNYLYASTDLIYHCSLFSGTSFKGNMVYKNHTYGATANTALHKLPILYRMLLDRSRKHVQRINALVQGNFVDLHVTSSKLKSLRIGRLMIDLWEPRIMTNLVSDTIPIDNYALRRRWNYLEFIQLRPILGHII